MAEAQHITLRELRRRVKAALEGGAVRPARVGERRNFRNKGQLLGPLLPRTGRKGGDNGVPTAQARPIVWRSLPAHLRGYFEEAETGQPLAAGIRYWPKCWFPTTKLYGFSLQITDMRPAYRWATWAAAAATIAQLQQEESGR